MNGYPREQRKQSASNGWLAAKKKRVVSNLDTSWTQKIGICIWKWYFCAWTYLKPHFPRAWLRRRGLVASCKQRRGSSNWFQVASSGRRSCKQQRLLRRRSCKQRRGPSINWLQVASSGRRSCKQRLLRRRSCKQQQQRRRLGLPMCHQLTHGAGQDISWRSALNRSPSFLQS